VSEKTVVVDVPASGLGHRVTVDVRVVENEPPPPPPPPPYPYAFVADPARVKEGESVRLSYSGPPEVDSMWVRGSALEFTRDAAGVMGAVTVEPSFSESYRLEAFDTRGELLKTIEADVFVEQPPPPPPPPFPYSCVAEPARIRRGETVRLWFSAPPEVWSVALNGEALWVDVTSPSGVKGSTVQQPEADQVYTMAFKDAEGNVLREISAFVLVDQPVVPYEYQFSVMPGIVKPGESALLRFTVPPEAVTLQMLRLGVWFDTTTNERGSVGTAVVWPEMSEDYTLTAYNAEGEALRTLSVRVEVELPPPPPPPPQPDPLTFPRLDASCLEYEGSCAFDNATVNGTRVGYGGQALAWDPATETFLMGGHDAQQNVARFQLPELVKVGDGPLRKAVIVEEFFDPVDGLWSKIGDRGSAKVGGLLPWGDRLLASVWHFYDSGGTQKASHFVSQRALDVPDDAVGPFKLGTLKTGYTSRYMADVPMAWRDLLGGPAFAGNCGVPIVSRTSSGPCAFTFNPDGVAAPAGLTPLETTVPATPLVYYPIDIPLEQWDATSQMWNGTATVGGLVMPDGGRSVLFFGSFGPGEFCYGTKCFPGAGQGNHAVISQPDGTFLPAPYFTYVWEYDAAELAAVRRGELKPWALRPRYWPMTLPISGSKAIRGVAFDRARQRLLLSQRNGESVFVHAYRVKLPA
jgi:hypothetical protein